MLPIDWDPLTTVALGLVNTPIFQNFMEHLVASREATAKWDTLGPLLPGATGVTVHFAYATKGRQFVSNVARVHIVP